MDDASPKPTPCWKEPYDYRREAAAAMANVKSRTGVRAGAKPEVFRCEHCGKWHWGHKRGWLKK